MPESPIDADRVGQSVFERGLKWLYSDTTGSTNADVLRYYERHRGEAIAFSESQSAGRGRRGRQWHSPYASNIYCSIGLFKQLPANRQGLLSIVTGIALCRSLRQAIGAELRLKWPNDLLYRERKLGGVLIESRPHGDDQFYFAVGFGLNVFMPEQDLAAIDQPVASLEQICGRGIDRTDILSAAITEVLDSIREFDLARVGQLATEFADFDAFHQRQVEVIRGDQRISGINRGIDELGQLRLETRDGLQVHAAAEISLRGHGA